MRKGPKTLPRLRHYGRLSLEAASRALAPSLRDKDADLRRRAAEDSSEFHASQNLSQQLAQLAAKGFGALGLRSRRRGEGLVTASGGGG